MRKSRWNEKEIEDMLRELPRVTDDRTKAEIMVGIEDKKKKKKKHSLHLMAGVASLFLMIVLASALMTGKEGEVSQEKSDSNRKLSVSESKESADYGAKSKEKSSDDIQEKQALSTEHPEILAQDEELDMVPFKGAQENMFAHAIYEDELKNASTITMGIPDDQMNIIVPVSIKLKYFDESDTLIQMVKQMSTIDEEQYGLSDYFPLDVTISKGTESTTAHIEFQEDSSLLDEDVLFLASMEETLSYNNITKMTFATDGKPGAKFLHKGFLKKLDIPQHKHRTYLLYKKDESSPSLLVPSNVKYQSFAEALQAAKSQSDMKGIAPAIPKDLNWKRVNFNGSHVTIHLAENMAMENSKQTLQALEAILFIAKDFGYETVRFENASIEKVGHLDLTGDIAVPRAPNQMN
ncbi:hypothetical protein [Peribacillus muralis]|uniref:hypothetical protein n=1 Tax=Peribacillus muralis TaxID=264697 RepID=UPI003D04F5EB